MFINEIDKFIDIQFNFIKDYVTRYKFNKILKKDSVAFIQYYNKLINNTEIDYTEIFQNIQNDKHKIKIRNIIEKYILFYLLLFFGIQEDDFNNENKDKFIESIFVISSSLPILDSVIIGNLLGIYHDMYICITLVSFLKNKKDLPINDDTTPVIQIFNLIGIDNVIKFFDISKKENIHNILKTFIYQKLYIKNDKKEIATIIEENTFVNAEYKYITVIESRIKDIDFASIEMLFDIENRQKGYPDDFYKFIEDYQIVTLGDIEENLNPEFAKRSNLISDDQKISYLFHKKILLPITDEILRFHVKEEKYITEVTEKNNQKTYQKVDTKLNYIINKIHLVTEHARNELTKKLYYQPLFDQQAIPYNDIEEMKIMKKFVDIGRINAENVTSFSELLSFRIYPYINYHDYSHDGFSHKHTYVTDALRYTNFRFHKNQENKNINWRIISNDNYHIENKHNFNCNIVGIALPKYINFLPYNIRCLKLNKMVNVRKYNKNGYRVTNKILEDIIINNKNCKKTPFWIFDRSTDVFIGDKYENINNIDKSQFFKKLIGNIYTIVEKLTFNRIINVYKQFAPLTLYQSNQIFDIITKRFVPIPQFSNYLAKINYARYYTYLPQRLNISDNRDTVFSKKDLIKLPTYQPKNNINIIKININKKRIIQETELEKFNAVCQHTITLNEIQRLREKDPTTFTKKLNDFYKKYIIDKKNTNFICKSCLQFVNIEKYIEQFDDLIKITAESKTPLDQQVRYSKFSKAIMSLDKIIERMGSIFNLSEYIGIKSSAILKRRETIRQLLDILLSSQELRVQNPSEFDNNFNMISNAIGTKYSEYYTFPVENDIFTYSSRDTDKFKRRKYNTILSHIAVLMLLDISNSNIITFNPDKLINILIFEKYGLNTLDNIKLRINTTNDLVYLGNYLLMGYVIYYMSSMMIRYKVYEIENKDIDIKKNIPPIDRLHIMHTMVHILAIIVDREQKSSNYLYTILQNNYFIKLSNVYNQNNSEKILTQLRNASQKKINNLQNNLSKKIVTTKQTYQLIDGKFNYTTYYNVIPPRFQSMYIYRRYFPKKLDNDTYKLSSDEINNMIRKNLYYLYQHEQSLIKLNINIFTLDKSTLSELYKIKEKYIETMKIKMQEQKKEILKLENKKQKIINKLDKTYNNLKNDLLSFDDVLETFLLKLEKYVSTNQSIFIEDFYLRKSIFIINHDIAGFSITPFKVDKIIIKYNDAITKKDVIIYRENVTERYYDIYTLAYLGYKTPTTDFVEIKNYQYLIIKYSLADKIKYMGLYNKYMNILPLEKQLLTENNYRGDILYNNLEKTNQIIVDKIQQDKILIEKFQRIIYSIRNKAIKQKEKESDVNKNKEYVLINEFIPRLINLKILNNDYELFLQNWKNTCSSYKIIPMKEIKVINNKYIDSNVIVNNYNNLIKYLLLDLIKLLDMNTDKTNIILSNLISLIFNLMWEEYEIKNNYEINKFLLILYTNTNDYDIDKSNGVDSDMPTPDDLQKLPDVEKEKINELTDDFKEEQDAIDMEPTDEEDLDYGEQNLINYDRDQL